jgi:hypothetical protein
MEIDTETNEYQRYMKLINPDSFTMHRVSDYEDTSKRTEANITIRVLLKGLEVSPSEIRVQVTSEEDVQLYY